MRHILDAAGGSVPDVAGAVELVFRDILPPLEDIGATIDPNAFRRDECYTEEVDTVLRRHEASLRGLFESRAKRHRLKVAPVSAAGAKGAARSPVERPYETLLRHRTWINCLRDLDVRAALTAAPV
jgi:hypothetical protein